MLMFVADNMHSSSSCGGSKDTYAQYEMEIISQTCRRVADIKISWSCDNSGRLFFKCSQCDKFLKWAKRLQGVRMEEDEGNMTLTMHQSDCEAPKLAVFSYGNPSINLRHRPEQALNMLFTTLLVSTIHTQ